MPKSFRVNLLLYSLIGLILCCLGFNRYRLGLNDRLMEAVRQNREADVLALLDQGADPNYSPRPRRRFQTRATMLTAAIQAKESERILRALLEHGANPKPPMPAGESPAERAIAVDRPDILRLLLDKGVREGSSPNVFLTHPAALRSGKECYRLLREYHIPSTLEDAVIGGDLDDVKTFLDQGNPVNQVNGYDATLLMQALNYRRAEVAKLLIARGADVNRASRFATPLRQAQQMRNPEIISLLKAKGAHLSLVEAIRAKDIQSVRDRIREGANVNQMPPNYLTGLPNPDYSPLIQAVAVQDPAIVHLLLDRGANVNSKDVNVQTPLILAVHLGNLDIVRALIDRGADLNSTDGYRLNPVTAAIQHNNLDIYRILKEKGAQIDLFDAASMGDVERIRKLVRQGADINRKNRQGETPLMLAAFRGENRAMLALLDLGANTEIANVTGETALLKVAWTEHIESLRFLLDRGANPNAVTASGKTTVMRAAESGRVENLRELLAAGGDPRAVSNNGDTALSLADRRGRAEIVALLRQAGVQE